MTTKATEQVDSHKTQDAVHTQKLTAPLAGTVGLTHKAKQPAHTAGQ